MKSLVDITDRRFALVLVDIQSMFTDETPGLGESIVTRIGTINDAVEGFRRSGLPVVYIRYEGLDHSGQEIDPERTGFIDGLLQPEAGEHIIGKIEMDAFLGTDLEDILKDKGCDSVLICGMVAQYCVLATYFGAFQSLHAGERDLLHGRGERQGRGAHHQDAIDGGAPREPVLPFRPMRRMDLVQRF